LELYRFLLAGAGSALAQKGGTGGGGLNTTTVGYSPTNYTVPPAATGSSSGVTITLFDTGSSSLAISSVTVSGAQAADYSLGGTCIGGAVIARGGNCTLQVTFAPLAVGLRTATVNATFLNATALSLPVRGQGVVPGPSISINAPGSATFNSVQVGTPPPSILFPAEMEIQMENIGGQPLAVSRSIIGANPGDFVFGRTPSNSGGPCLDSTTLQTLSQCGIGINFVPTAEGLRAATLHITTNDPARPVIDIAMSGVGTPAPAPTPTPAPTPVVSSADFTDLWGTTGEQDWNLSVNHHKATTDALVAVWHTHDVDGSDMWLELKDGHWVDGLTFTGSLHRLKGTAFSLPNDPSLFSDTVVGSATLTFTDNANGTFAYTMNGVSGSKSITRLTF
jgi:hypothetical protein